MTIETSSSIFANAPASSPVAGADEERTAETSLKHASDRHPERSEGPLPSTPEETLRFAQDDGSKPSISSSSTLVAPLLLRRLSIRRLAGIDAGFSLDDLSPGINVIYGPNGVGKSRTAWAVNLCLWPGDMGRDRRESVSASFDIGDDEWAIEVDADVVRHQRNGNESKPPELIGPEARDRYNLSLQDLLAGRGDDFAGAILRESAGGFDLSAAARELGFDRRPSPRSGKESEALAAARQKVHERQQGLDGLRRRARELDDMVLRRDAARAASDRAGVLRLAIDLADARLVLSRAEDARRAFPPAIALLNGNEPGLLRQLRGDLSQIDKADAKDRQALSRAEADKAATRLDDARLDDSLVPRLAEDSRKLDELRKHLESSERELREADARLDKARAAMGATVSNEKLEQLSADQFPDLADLAKKAEQARADLVAARTLGQWLEMSPATLQTRPSQSRAVSARSAPAGADSQGQVNGDDSDQPNDPGPARVEQGIVLLGQWLRQPAPSSYAADRNGWLMAAAAIIVALSLLLAWQLHWALLVLAPVGPGLYFAWRLTRPRAVVPSDRRQFIEDEYAALLLPIPSRWSSAEVESLFRAMSDQLAALKVGAERAQRLAELQPRLDEAARRHQELDARRAAVALRLGVAPDIDESSLHVLAAALVRWQEAFETRTGAAGVLEMRRAEYDQTLSAAADRLQEYGYEVRNCAALDSAREDLRGRFQSYRTSCTKIDDLTAALRERDAQRVQIADRITAIFTNAGLAAGDDATLNQLIDQREAFAQAGRDITVARARVRELEAKLADEPALSERTRDDLLEELERIEGEAAKYHEILEQIAALSREIELAKRASDLEAAQAERREAAAALAAARDADCSAAAGWALVEHLRAATRDRHRPVVFHRARELFTRITRGRYRLEFDDQSSPPSFRAFDTVNGIGQAIGELSGGTRVQLLLAVRVAFVEQQERGPRLPLLLDEALANSDESRARQIVDAVLEICRAGRQVFYFTAQPDEVGKWREILDARASEESAVLFKLIDLAAVRGLAETERTPPRRIVTVPAPQVPAPHGLDREQYGQLLKAPGIDPRRDSAGAVHLWHLVDDQSTLHLLLKLGRRTWGEWKTMVEHCGGAGSGAEIDAFRQAGARARAIEALSRNWRIGRGRSVDRQAILDCKAVTERFKNEVAEIAAAEGGDARRLIARLENKDVRGFRSASIDDLKAWLVDQGFVDERPPLSPEELRLRALAAVESDIRAGDLSVQVVEEYQATWFGGG